MKSRKTDINQTRLFRHYYPVGIFQDNEKNLFEILSQETARDILIFSIEQKNPTQTDIVEKIGVSAALVSWHAGRLIELGMITEIRDTRDTSYGVIQITLVSLMKNYYPSLWDRWSNRLAEMFLSTSKREKGL